VSNIVTTQIVIITLPYCDVVLTVAWIGIPYVKMIREVECRACIEIRVSVIIPGPPLIVSLVSGDHPDAGGIGIALNFNIFYINALSAFRHHVDFHHAIDHVILG
jgi:hypothetical protein